MGEQLSLNKTEKANGNPHYGSQDGWEGGVGEIRMASPPFANVKNVVKSSVFLTETLKKKP